MTGGLSTQVKVNVKPISAFKSGLMRQVVFECRGLKIQGPLYKLLPARASEQGNVIGLVSVYIQVTEKPFTSK